MAVKTSPSHELVVGNYRLIRPLGEGGMGRVYLAEHQIKGTQVVIKLMREDRARDPAFRRLFQSELRVMMQFRHPHAVALLDASGEADPLPFLVLEYVNGQDLEALLQRNKRFSPTRLGLLLGKLCTVLQAAHDQGTLHRDLSANNLMIVEPGTPRESLKVMDFGLARLGGFYIALEKLNGEDQGFGGGTPDYVCPEQLRGEEVDGRGDLYSVGVVLYRALTGRFPFESATAVDAILRAQLEQAPPSFAQAGVYDVPARVEAVVHACLAKRANERPQSARELAQQYGAALGCPIVDPRAFDVPDDANNLGGDPAFAPESLVDRFEAWMPEKIAIMKLRGFIDGLGGAIVDSVPGLIRVRLPAPNQTPAAASKGIFGWLRQSAAASPVYETIELHIEKKPSTTRSLVDIAVVRPRVGVEGAMQREAGHNVCRTLCRELRAYLMIGR